MFEEALNKVRELSRSTIATENEIVPALEAYKDLKREITNAKRRLVRKREAKALTREAKLIYNRQKKLFPDKLIEAIDLAIGTNKEFDNRAYRELLYEVAKELSIYKYEFAGSGLTLRLSGSIVFESEAGTLSDWGRGITIYREETLKSKIGDEEDDYGGKATEWWLSRVYGNEALYAKTILGRKAASGRKAAFWQLLNSGTVPLSSDRPDGSYNPLDPSVPTDFVGDADRSIKREFNAEYFQEAAIWYDELQFYEKEISEVHTVVEEVSNEVKNLKVEASQNRAIFNKLGKLKKYSDEKKLAQAARKYRAGEEFETKTINIAKSSKRPVRLTVRRLEGLMEY